jgi:hypothetical protein
MSGAMNWPKIEAERKLNYRPSLRVQAATQKQLDYIIGLAHEKGQPKPRLPKTKYGASQIIERLLVLPDVPERKSLWLAPAPVRQPNHHQEMVIELREHWPQLSPMSVNSLVQLFSQVDPIGLAFVLDGLYEEVVPEEPSALILFVLARFLQEFAGLRVDDDSTLVSG